MARGAAFSVAVLVVFLAAWQWGPGLLGIPTFIVPPLSTVANEFVRMLSRNALMFHTGVTAAEVIAGFILGSLLGAFFGYMLGMSPTAEFALSPYILALQIAPKVAFAPLFIMWMGFTVYPKILVAILIVFFPVMVNVLTAIRTVDPDLINLARAFKATRAQIFWKIEFPASLPPLFAGLRIGSTLAVVGVVVGELVGGNMGLGYLLAFGEGQANTPMVFVTILMLTLVGGVAYLGVILIETRVLHYLPKRALGGILIQLTLEHCKDVLPIAVGALPCGRCRGQAANSRAPFRVHDGAVAHVVAALHQLVHRRDRLRRRPVVLLGKAAIDRSPLNLSASRCGESGVSLTSLVPCRLAVARKSLRTMSGGGRAPAGRRGRSRCSPSARGAPARRRGSSAPSECPPSPSDR